MANSLRSALRAKVVVNLEGRTDLTTAINTALDDACEDLSTYAWKELDARDSSTSTTAEVQYITLPSAVATGAILSVFLVDDTNSYPVPLRSRAVVEALYPVADEFSSGKPHYCYQEGSKLYFAPMPNSVLVVRIIYKALLAIATADASQISAAGFDSLVVAYATAEVFESIEHGKETASRWWSVYNSRLRRKLLSQGSTGEENMVDTRLDSSPPLPRDPSTVAWW